MTQCSFINQTKVQKLHGYQTCIESLSDRNFFEILTNIISQTPKALRTTGVLLQVRLDVVSMGILSLSTSAGQDKHRWAFVC